MLLCSASVKVEGVEASLWGSGIQLDFSWKENAELPKQQNHALASPEPLDLQNQECRLVPIPPFCIPVKLALWGPG